MKINNLYLKLGVAATATFSLGFFLGRLYQGRKYQKVLNQVSDKMRDYKDALVEDEHFGPLPQEETPPAPVEKEQDTFDIPEENTLTPMEDVLMAAERKHIEEGKNNPCYKMTQDRLRDFLLEKPADEVDRWKALVHHISKNFPPDELMVEDRTPWRASLERPTMCCVYEQATKQFYWTDYSYIMDDLFPFDEEDLDSFMVAFFCFSTYREDDEGNRYPVLATTEQNIDSDLHEMQFDEHVYDFSIRYLYIPLIDKEIVIKILDKGMYTQDFILKELHKIILDHGGAIPEGAEM